MNKMNYEIIIPGLNDLEGIVEAQRDAWRDSYPSPENGVSKEWVYEKSEGFSSSYIAARLDGYTSDSKTLYIAAKANDGEILGFLHADKKSDYNELGAIYLSPKYIGSGVGGTLMQRFLAWLDPSKPSRLECVSYNQRAIGFYEHYGFKISDKLMPKFGDVMPTIEMIRSVKKGVSK